MSIIYVNPFQFAAAPPSGYDPDAQAYITAVETADGQALETGVRDAINAFVVGCKSDGIWSAIKASCILAGARTLNGALVPLTGTAPTNYNFLSSDYNRKTGLKGDVTTKYLDSNRAANADPTNDFHLSIYQTEVFTSGIGIIGQDNTGSRTAIYFSGSSIRAANVAAPGTNSVGFLGGSRSSSTSYEFRRLGTTSTITANSGAPSSSNIMVFRRDAAVSDGVNSRLSFYSIGESLDLALLDARVSTLMSALAAAIP
jgi:hypothetical protein